MKLFDTIIGKRIIKIQRIDRHDDYDFYSPYALILSIEKLDEKLVLAANNDGTSTDIRLSNDINIEGDFGLEVGEGILNDLKPEDELNQFRNHKIERVRIAEFVEPEIQGDGFLIKQGKIAGIELKTEKSKVLSEQLWWLD